MHEAALARAALPAPTVIQRTPLRPYSLGHELLLIREGNAFLCGGPPTRKDVIQGVWICANTWDENRRVQNEFLAPLKAWIIARRFKRCNLGLCLKAFQEYLESSSLEFALSDIPRPSSAPSSSATRIPGSPFILRLHHFLMTHLRKSESEAWDYPVGLAKMRWACHWEQEGGLDVRGPHDESFEKYQADPKTQEALAELKRKAGG